jgi:hypothetical protein
MPNLEPSFAEERARELLEAASDLPISPKNMEPVVTALIGIGWALLAVADEIDSKETA